MILEGVIVCKDYSDFLEHTLPENLQYFDRLVVVAHPCDRATIDLCNRYSVDVVLTESMHEYGAKFDKARAINIGLGHLKGEDWILHLDADIVLPHRFRHLLWRAQLDRKNLYGADRVNVYGYDYWMAHKAKTIPHHTHRYFVEPPREFPLGARIVHQDHGYAPIGFFQLWHATAGKKYPIVQGNAENTDVLFAIQWPRANRVLLPEVFVYHLDSEKGPKPMGANWNGRTTPHFGPVEKKKCL